jgi:hypothetical protein
VTVYEAPPVLAQHTNSCARPHTHSLTKEVYVIRRLKDA